MVLRMMMRWAERRGFKVELLEASAGEEAGIKSATFRVSGENAYGLYSAEKGVHRLVRLSPVRRRQPPPDELRGRRGGARGRGRGRRRDRGRRPADRHLPRLRRRRPARQQDRLGGADHPQADRRRRAVPERALAVGQQGDGDGDAALQAGRARRARAPGGDRARARRGAGRQLRLADPLLRPAPVHDGQGPPHRLRGRQRRARARRRPRRLRPRVARGEREGVCGRTAGCRTLPSIAGPRSGWFWRFTWPDGRAAIVLCGVCPGWALVGVATQPGRLASGDPRRPVGRLARRADRRPRSRATPRHVQPRRRRRAPARRRARGRGRGTAPARPGWLPFLRQYWRPLVLRARAEGIDRRAGTSTARPRTSSATGATASRRCGGGARRTTSAATP